MDVGYVFAALTVSDRDQAADWYARLFGRPADMLPNDAEAAWQLAESASLFLRADPGRAGQGTITLIVTNLEAELAQVAARGVATGPVQQVGEAGTKSVITDPDGNTVELVQLNDA
jgi:predicted enzyme related to lactoylglutathione lyase